MTWRFPRQAIRSLPAPAQLLIKRGQAALRQDDWAASIKRLRLQEQDYLNGTRDQNAARPGQRRVLFFVAQQTPPWLEVEYSLAAALWLRGHDICGTLCDGLLPLCEMNLGRTERPPCDLCAGWLTRYEDAFGFNFSRLTQFASWDDRLLAEQQVAGAADRDLEGLTVDTVNVGRLARRELQRYHRGFVFEPSADPAYRQWLVSAILLVRWVSRLLDREHPDVVLCASGRTLSSASLCAVARSRDIRVVTWDTEPTFSDGLVFSHDEAAVLIPLDEAWRQASQQPLTCDAIQALDEFLRGWERSQTPPHPTHHATLDDHGAIRSQLGLRSDASPIVAFANSVWDMAVVDRDLGFANMFEWLFALVEFAKRHPAIDLVVRAHPSEVNGSHDLHSRTPVGAEIVKRHGPLPGNIKLVDGLNPVDSYALAALAGVVLVYASRIGLEVALRGKQPWLAGETTYRGKGFTRDLSGTRQMCDLLDAGVTDDVLSADRIDLAQRFAYLWFFRYVTRVPLLRPLTRPFALRTFRALGPGGDPTVDRICTSIITGAPFVDLARPPPHCESRSTSR